MATGSDTYNQGISNVQSANNQGQSAVSSFDPSAWSSTTNSGLSSVLSNYNNQQNDYQKAFMNQIQNGQPTAQGYYQQGQKLFNVQPLQQTANQLNNAVLQDPINNVNASKGFNVDNSQIQQKTNQDLEYLSPVAQAAQNSANSAQQNALNYTQAGEAQNNLNIIPYQQEGQYIQQAMAQAATGWDANQQAALSALQAKMQAGVQLSAQEMQSYATLTQAEQQYQAAIAANQAGIEEAKLGQQFQALSPGQQLYNVYGKSPGTAIAGSAIPTSYGAGGGNYTPPTVAQPKTTGNNNAAQNYINYLTSNYGY